jgi:hypothetical protein
MKRIAGSVLIVTLIAVIMWQQRRVHQLIAEGAALQKQRFTLFEQIQQLTDDRDKAVNDLATSRAESNELSRNKADLIKLRNEVARLQRNEAARDSEPAYIKTKELLNRVDKVRKRLSETPAAMIPEMRFLKERDYWDACRDSLETEGDYLSALSSLRRTAERTFVSTLLQPALKRYAEANSGQFPSDLGLLRPYFASPVEDAILDRWTILPVEALGETVSAADLGKTVITTRVPVDENWDARYVLGLERYISVGRSGSFNGWGVTNPNTLLAPAIQTAAEAYKAANGGREPDELTQAALFLNLTTQEQRSTFEKLIQWSQKR